MKKQIALIIALVFICLSHIQAQDFHAKLMKDLVKVANNKMTIEDYNLLTLTDGTTLQIKSHAEVASQGVISRDNFIMFFGVIATGLVLEMQKGDEDAKLQELDEITGNPDVEINIYMSKSGVQLEIKTSDGVNRSTMKWEDLFKD